MADSIKLNKPASSSTAPLKAPQKKAEPVSASGKIDTGDQFKRSAPLDEVAAVALLKDVAMFPPMPEEQAAQKAWLMDGFSNLMKASAAQDVLRKAWSDGKADPKLMWEAADKVRALETELARSPQYADAKKEFFQGMVGPAQKILDALAVYPAAPKNKAAKAKWLAEGKALFANAKAADQILNDAWFKYKALDLSSRADGSHKLFQFESRLNQAEWELTPPSQRPKPAKGGRPLFDMTSRVADGMNKAHGPIASSVESAALPFAVTLDMIDVLTRPLTWLDALPKK